jgi:hypothetical protein
VRAVYYDENGQPTSEEAPDLQTFISSASASSASAATGSATPPLTAAADPSAKKASQTVTDKVVTAITLDGSSATSLSSSSTAPTATAVSRASLPATTGWEIEDSEAKEDANSLLDAPTPSDSGDDIGSDGLVETKRGAASIDATYVAGGHVPVPKTGDDPIHEAPAAHNSSQPGHTTAQKVALTAGVISPTAAVAALVIIVGGSIAAPPLAPLFCKIGALILLASALSSGTSFGADIVDSIQRKRTDTAALKHHGHFGGSSPTRDADDSLLVRESTGSPAPGASS